MRTGHQLAPEVCIYHLCGCIMQLVLMGKMTSILSGSRTAPSFTDYLCKCQFIIHSSDASMTTTYCRSSSRLHTHLHKLMPPRGISVRRSNRRRAAGVQIHIHPPAITHVQAGPRPYSGPKRVDIKLSWVLGPTETINWVRCSKHMNCVISNASDDPCGIRGIFWHISR